MASSASSSFAIGTRWGDRSWRSAGMATGRANHGYAEARLREGHGSFPSCSEGKDPQFQREMHRQANSEAERKAREDIEREARKGTLSDLVTSYVTHLRAQGKASASDTQKTLERHLLQPFPELAARRARDITADDVTDVLARMIAKGIERRTNIVRSMLRAAFAYGAELDNDPVRKAEALKAGGGQSAKLFGIIGNPVADIKRVGKYDRARDRVLTDAELRAYLSALEKPAPRNRRCATTALLLGGQRMSQLLRATWSDYDPEERVLSLKDGKGRGGEREHVLPVIDRVASLLEGLRGINQRRPVYLFHARRSDARGSVNALQQRRGDRQGRLQGTRRLQCSGPSAHRRNSPGSAGRLEGSSGAIALPWPHPGGARAALRPARLLAGEGRVRSSSGSPISTRSSRARPARCSVRAFVNGFQPDPGSHRSACGKARP